MTNFNWASGHEGLMEFVSSLNDMHEYIKFTVEVEQNGQLSFLDILIKRHQDGTLGCTVYKKLTHINFYLNNWSHHYPAQKCGVILMLLDIAHHVADTGYLKDEWEDLKVVFHQKSYTTAEIEQVFRSYGNKNKCKQDTEEDPISGVVLITYCSTVMKCLTRLLQWGNTRTTLPLCKK